MANFYLENEEIKVEIDSHGCEIRDVLFKCDNTHRMWNANPEGWKRVAPVLFPLIGKYKDNKSEYDGEIYEMSQHGFARDMEFELVSEGVTKLEMKLVSNTETKIKYPFNFEFLIKYEIFGPKIVETYKVINTDNKIISFSVGAHPAFVAPDWDRKELSSMAGCKIGFDKEKISYGLLSGDGLLIREEYELPLKDGEYTVEADTFDKDALIIENSQATSVYLSKNGQRFVTVNFDAPVFGLWSCAKKNVPFVCIEPWYGRTDAIDFSGSLMEREWANELMPGETFEKKFEMIFS